MKFKSLFLMLCAGALFVACNRSEKSSQEDRIKQLVSRMSLEEKVGQMTQMTLDAVGKGPDLFSSYLPFAFDEAMLDTVIGQYRIGSILNAATENVMSLEEWQPVVRRIQEKSLAATGIPCVYGVDAIHGVTYGKGATMLPQEITVAATFNRELAHRSGEICAYETRACHIPWNFSPVLDMGRNPCWPRLYETFGEDVYLVSEMGKAIVRGYQGDSLPVDKNHVAACLKHYLGYGVPVSGKDRTPAIISGQELREKHFRPFREAIEAGALTVMVNSGLINGIPVHASKTLITGWLKEGLKWDGMVVTDWADIDNVYTRDHLTETRKEAVALCINAGIDMVMVPYDYHFCEVLKECIEEGLIPMSRIDDAVSRVLRLKYRLGLFDDPYQEYEYPGYASGNFSRSAYDVACEAITLLKNKDSLLPLKANTKILVTGPNAGRISALNGGWTYTWQGRKTDELMPEGISILQAMQERFGAANIRYEAGVTYKMGDTFGEENTPEIDKAVRAAAGCDCIVLCVGEDAYSETPGNINDLSLSENQQQLALALAKTGKPIIMVLNEGRPRIISKIEPAVSAILQIYLPGNEGGKALAATLAGDVNPSGKLPYTYPKYPNSLTTCDHKPSESVETMQGGYDYNAVVSVQWAFGFGLSYTAFEYAGLTVDKESFSPADMLTVSVDVKNTGQVAGKESVLLFVNDLVASLTPDVRRLRGFEKISLDAGESKRVSFALPASELAFVGEDGRYILEKGDFNIQIGSLSKVIKCTETKKY